MQSSNAVRKILQEWEEITTFTETESILLEKIRELTSEQEIPEKIRDQILAQQPIKQETEPVTQQSQFVKGSVLNRLQNVKQDQQMQELLQYQSLAKSLLASLTSTIELLSSLQLQYQQTTQTTSSLHQQCEQLVQEREQLGRMASGIEVRLNYFADFDNVVDKIITEVDAQPYAETLEKLDQSILFLSANMDYKESKSYLAKFKQIQARALANLRDIIVTKFRTVTASCKNLDQSKTQKALGLDTKFLYMEFRHQLQPLKPLILQLQKNPHQIFLMDILDQYHTSRLELILPIVSRKIIEIVQKDNLTILVREGCSFLEEICVNEESVFDALFSNLNHEALLHLQATFCEIIHEGLRALVVKQSSIDELCELITILRTEVLIRKKMFEPVVHRMIQDVQERLIYLSAVFLKEKIRAFKPIVVDPSTHYPTLELTITFLTKLYQSVDLGVFDNLAQEAVSMCTDTFIEASKKLTSEKKSIMEVELFLIKHLILLQQQISIFEISFTKTETVLDFSHLREGISRFLRGQASIRSSIIFDIMSQATPRIIHTNVDTRRNLEQLLRTYCDDFILNVTRLALDPIMNVLKRENASESDKIGAFETVKSSTQSVLENLKTKLPLYLTNKSTQANLFSAVCNNMVEVYTQFYNQVQDKQSIWSIQEFTKTLDSYGETDTVSSHTNNSSTLTPLDTSRTVN
jgi:hypothetical protein